MCEGGECLLMRAWCFLLCIVYFSFSGVAQAAGEPELISIRWSVQSSSVDGSKVMRIVADTTSPVKVSCSYEEKGEPRIIVDIKGALPGKNIGVLPIKSEKIKKVEGKRGPYDSTQLIIYLSEPFPKEAFKVFTLKKDPANKKPDRVVIDVFEKMPKTYKITPSLKDKTIVIDPGHGGSDPGAIGLNKTFEKDITLSISLKLRDELVKKGAKVVMTRTTDRDVHSKNASDREELQARVDVGGKAGADVFVSVHCNANAKRDVGGLSTYYYAKTKYDFILASNIQKNLAASCGLDDKGVRQAEFFVTKRSGMPATLLEIAFISNPKEEKLLKSNWFQNKMATSIVKGLEDYFEQASGGGGK